MLLFLSFRTGSVQYGLYAMPCIILNICNAVWFCSVKKVLGADGFGLSRLNDLLIGKYDGMFYEYYGENREYAQIIADTRHYYTHYGKSKENNALKGDELLEAIYILKILLEYHVCLVLGVDNHEKISREPHNHHEWRKLGFIQSGKT